MTAGKDIFQLPINRFRDNAIANVFCGNTWIENQNPTKHIDHSTFLSWIITARKTTRELSHHGWSAFVAAQC